MKIYLPPEPGINPPRTKMYYLLNLLKYRDGFKIYSPPGCYLYRRFKNEVRLSRRRRNVFGIIIRNVDQRNIIGSIGETAAFTSAFKTQMLCLCSIEIEINRNINSPHNCYLCRPMEKYPNYTE